MRMDTLRYTSFESMMKYEIFYFDLKILKQV